MIKHVFMIISRKRCLILTPRLKKLIKENFGNLMFWRSIQNGLFFDLKKIGSISSYVLALRFKSGGFTPDLVSHEHDDNQEDIEEKI